MQDGCPKCSQLKATRSYDLLTRYNRDSEDFTLCDEFLPYYWDQESRQVSGLEAHAVTTEQMV